jgi:Mg-chelatase subunit ChlD
MNRILRYAALMSFALWLPLAAAQLGQKKDYDITEKARTKSGVILPSLSGVNPGWSVAQTYGEATMLPGGYYTLGTARSLSGTSLDSLTTITYGHPFARTSYPVIHVDGAWGKMDDLLSGDSMSVQVTMDSIALTRVSSHHVRATFSLTFADEGRRFVLKTRLSNGDNSAHTLGCGFALDPSLGNRGDGVFTIGGKDILRDTVLGASALQNSIVVTERASSKKGMRIGLGFPSGVPNTCLVANWRDVMAGDSTSPSMPSLRVIYDLMLKLFWPPESVEPGAVLSHSFDVTLLPPDFGSGVFLRWDLPGFASLDDGIVFPRDFSSWVALTNMSAGYKSGLSVQLTPSLPLQSSATLRTTDISGNGFQYVSFPLSVNEVYEDQVAPMLLVCSEGGVPVDSLVRPFFVPATPVSDTGLTVTIDSIITSSYPQISLLFQAQMSSTLQKLYNIAPENVFLYDNGTRISDVTLGKELGDGSGQVDIVFVLDVTGSMTEEITGVKNNILEFADSLVKRGVDFRLGMVTFLDVIENVYDFTSNAQQFKNNVALQYAHGGDDTPENSLDALYRASQMQFRESANKIFIWITDADYHEKDWATARTKQEVLDRLLLLDIVVNAIGAPMYQTDSYTPIVEPTGGQFYDINGNFRDILLDIGRLHGVGKYRLTYQAPVGASGTRDVVLTVHTAGLGGSVSTTYVVPGGSARAPLSCYPNPFNPLLRIRFSMGAADHAVITLFDILGRRVREFIVSAGGGEGEVVWDARNEVGQDVGTGMYFVRLSRFGKDKRALGSTLAKVLHLK